MNKCYCVSITNKKVTELEPLLNFLFIVHNNIEMKEMLNSIDPINGYGVILDFIEEDSMQHFYIGKFFKYNIVLTKTSDMGSINVNSAINIINRAIQIFKPNYIIMPGISAGLDEKLKIGDVVIADKIIGYESEKLASTEIIGRYPEFRSPRLYNLFCSANIHCFNNFIKKEILKELEGTCSKEYTEDVHNYAQDGSIEENEEFAWNKFIVNDCFPKVYTGNYISGEKLLDSAICRNILKLKFKEALALDMEGVGIASASAFNRVYDWLVIKGISDFGDGNKSKNKTLNQTFAMKNVVLALKKVFDNELSFSEINLKQINSIRKNVLISASQCVDGDFYDITDLFMETLARQLIINQYNVISGYGLNIGPAVMYGILDGCDQLGLSLPNYIERFKTFPFPRGDYKDVAKQKRMERCKGKNREILCSNTNIALFVFGNKKSNEEDNKPGIADGMFQELELANKNKALIMPIGCTNGTAKKIYETVIEYKDKYIRPYFSEKNKYGAFMLNVENEIENYISELTKLNQVILEKGNIDFVIKKIIEIINLYG